MAMFGFTLSHLCRHDALYFQSDRVVFITACWLLVHFYHVILFHLESFRCLIIINSSSVEEKPERSDWYPHPLRIRLLQLAHLRGLLYAEVDFVGILPNNFEFDVLGFVTHSLVEVNQ